jgi:hypothetical protein
LPKLGNARIASGRGGMQIADPSGGADELLQLVASAYRDRRRIVFFCACERPCNCHRAEVARLLVKAALRKEVGLTVVEWPGGEPKAIDLTVSKKGREGNSAWRQPRAPRRIQQQHTETHCATVGLARRPSFRCRWDCDYFGSRSVGGGLVPSRDRAGRQQAGRHC